MAMRLDFHALLVGVAVSLGAAPAAALTPEEVFTRVSPSVWFVYGADDTDRRLTQGSGVVVAPQRVITNCHVLENASTVFVRKENVIYIAKVEFRDARRDLCQLQVPNFTAPAVALGSSRELRVGQKVYALGNPKGLEVTLSDGLVSALRGPDGVEPIVQTTAPISPGSSGGGLFDDRGRLVGVTTLQRRDGQNLNFALPAEWVAELPQRVKLAAEETALARKLKDEQLAGLRERGVL
jgi:S1-C subfamily serine protease